MFIKRHFSFLSRVFLHSITAFGGPQAHLGMMFRHFCSDRRYIRKDELMDINTFCQLLPGATSTQTVTLIGFKRGGLRLAFLTLLIWALPAVILMSSFAFMITSYGISLPRVFRFFQPMALGFLCYASWNIISTLKQKSSKVIFTVSTMITLFLFHSPWFFPLVLIISSLLGYITEKKRPVLHTKSGKRISWKSLILFFSLFVMAGFLSETARKQAWKYRTSFNLFENMYRFGSTVFGGADVLIPVMYEQYVTRPSTKHIQQNNQHVISIQRDVFLTGAGLVRAIPGPAFSISSFIGGLALSRLGTSDFILGCCIGAIGIFLPSFLLSVSLFPLWLTLQQYEFLQRVLTGIKAGIVGVMLASIFFLTRDMYSTILNQSFDYILFSCIILLITFFSLFSQRVSPPLIVFLCAIIGVFF